MADEFQLGNGSWWDTSRNRFESGTTSSSISTTLNAIASYGWPTEMVDMKSSRDSATSSTAVCHDEQSSAGGGGSGGGVLSAPNLQMMGLGLSSQSMDWNQALLNEKGESSFRSLLQQDLSSNSANFQPEFKQINRGFSLDQPQFSSQASSNDSTITSQSLTTAFQVDSAAAYGLLLSENQQQPSYQNRPISNYPYPPSGGYAAEMIPSMNKYPPKQTPLQAGTSNHLHFTNNTPFWNAAGTPPADARSSFFPPSQNQIPTFDAKPKHQTKAEGRDLSAPGKKSSTEMTNKRARSEAPSPLPAFKVRKEKMGDRITALQQLVSPFGKTDTASVLSEAIEYIKFLHEQVSALSAPYMKNGAPMQNQQSNPEKTKDLEGGRQDLRSRGLCLVPVSSTFPVTHETSVDFWTPTFGGTFR
ncbi:transcription factor bHLH123 [Salvia divinorum]|uniref:Transcription factor bHLH123 n=1 Tax=Salvia divinorum TaxID=28513 RepID=A0ABD1IED6_SALDI